MVTTTYRVGGVLVETLNSIGASIERYHSADYWKIRMYVEDVFSPAIMAVVIPNTITTISITDAAGTITYTGTVTYFTSTVDYSYIDLLNCTVSFVPA